MHFLIFYIFSTLFFRTLRFVFIGPGMDMEEDGPCRGIESCPGCFKKNKKVEYEISSKTYQDFVQSER